MTAMTDKAGLSPKRSSSMHVDDEAVAAATGRMIRALGKRVATGDPDAAALLLELEEALRDAWETAVTGWRAARFTDGEIGAVLGTTKQAVQQRWPRA